MKTYKFWLLIEQDKLGAYVVGGSQCKAELITAENYGCVNHKNIVEYSPAPKVQD